MRQQLSLSGASFWTLPEVAILRQHYPVDGPEKCAHLLPHRTLGSIYQQARLSGLRAPKSPAVRHKWETTPYIDAEIRRVYQSVMKKNDAQKLAARLGYPRWWVCKRAALLGLVAPRFKEPAWSADEVALLEMHSTKHPKIIQKHLKAAGFERTETAIIVQRKRRKLETQDPDYYTTGELALMMGVDPTTVMRWIESEGLPARKGVLRRVSRAALRNWIRDHAQSVDLRKVDRFWFIDLAFSK